MAVTGTDITITTRTAKGSALTHAELDANQTGLKSAIENHSHNEFAAALGADDNYMTDAEKTKLAGIASGAEANVQADWNAVSGDAAILNKPTIPSITGLLNETAHDLLDHSGLPGIPASYSLPTASTTVLGGVKVDGTTVLISNGVISSTGGSGGGVTDHGLLTGLSDDDHTQYLNNTRHAATDHAGVTGVLAIGTTSGTACAGNDSRLSDARTPTIHSHAIADTTGLQTALAGKQAELVSGTNIKTINGVSVLGSGDIVVSGGSGMTNPMTAAGSIIIGGVGGIPAELQKGSDGQVLTLAAGSPAWGAAPTGGASSPLIAEYIVGTGTDSGTTHYVGGGDPLTQISISDLSLRTDGEYRITVTAKNATSVASGIELFLNGDTTVDNYNWRALYKYSTGQSGAYCDGGDSAVSAYHDACGYMSAGADSYAVVTLIPAPDSTYIETNMSYGPAAVGLVTHKWKTSADVTSLLFRATVAASMGVGTRITIRRI